MIAMIAMNNHLDLHAQKMALPNLYVPRGLPYAPYYHGHVDMVDHFLGLSSRAAQPTDCL